MAPTLTRQEISDNPMLASARVENDGSMEGFTPAQTRAYTRPQEAEDFSQLAAGLNYSQRKALRRLGRGRSVGRSMAADPLLARCFRIDCPPLPPHSNVVEYCDWEARAHYAFAHPILTDYGRELFSALEELRATNSTEE